MVSVLTEWIIPWSSGKPLVWDATCCDTFATSYQSLAAHAPGEVAARAEAQKLEKYTNLSHSHFFAPIAIKTTGVFGPKTMTFIRDLGRRISLQTGDLKSTAFLLQRLSVAVQLGNAASILGTWGLHPPSVSWLLKGDYFSLHLSVFTLLNVPS